MARRSNRSRSVRATVLMMAACAVCWLAHALLAQSCVPAETERDVASNRFAASVAALKTLIASEPQCADAHYLLAASLLRLGSAKDSLAEYTLAARLRTPSATDLRNVALDYVLLSDYTDARHWAARARDYAPGDPENWYVLGRIDYTDGNARQAAECFEQALRLDPASVKAKNNLGLAYEGLGQEKAAEAAYRKAIAMGEQASQPNEQPYINLAILLMHQPEAPGALALLLRAVSLAPNDARAQEQLGKLYMQTNQLALAQAALAQAVALSPADSRLHFLLGQVYRREGLNEKAAAEFASTSRLVGTRSTPDYVPQAPH